MANEIAASIQFNLTNGYHTAVINEQFNDDQSVIGQGGDTQVIGTSEEAVVFGDLSTPGWCILKNLDTTNYVDVGPDNSGMVPVLRIKPGKANAIFLYPGVTLKAQANTANVKLWVRAFEAGTGT